MSDHRTAAPVQWHRFSGAFANAVLPHGSGNDPTIGIAWYRCDCCGRDYLLVAAIAEDGTEVNVALPALAAADFFECAVGLVASMGRGCTRESVQ